MYGAVSARVAEEMRKPEVLDYFTKLVLRTSPKSYAQAEAEVTVTRRFFENFSGDQVARLLCCCCCCVRVFSWCVLWACARLPPKKP